MKTRPHMLAETALGNGCLAPRAAPAAQEPSRMMSIEAACVHANVSRSTFYETWLPRVRSARFGSRRLVERASLDEIIDQMLAEQAGGM